MVKEGTQLSWTTPGSGAHRLIMLPSVEAHATLVLTKGLGGKDKFLVLP